MGRREGGGGDGGGNGGDGGHAGDGGDDGVCAVSPATASVPMNTSPIIATSRAQQQANMYRRARPLNTIFSINIGVSD